MAIKSPKIKVNEKPAFKTEFIEVDFPADHKSALACLKESLDADNALTKAWGLYSKKTRKLEAIRFSREEAREYRAKYNIHRVTVIRGDRVR